MAPEQQKLLAAFAPVDYAPADLTAIYREIQPVDAPDETFSAIMCPPFGYVGLAWRGQRRVIFSVWDPPTGEAELIEGSPSAKTGRFTELGKTGSRAAVDYEWPLGERYKVFVDAQHVNDTTVYTAFFGSVADAWWKPIGRIARPGKEFMSRPGGFVEHPTKANPDSPRTTGFGGAWVRNDSGWHWIRRVQFQCNDPHAADARLTGDLVVVQIMRGLNSHVGERDVFELPEQTEIPRLPE